MKPFLQSYNTDALLRKDAMDTPAPTTDAHVTTNHIHADDLWEKHEFKLNPTLKTLMSWWASETATTESKPIAITSCHRRNLFADLGSETESEEDTPKQKKKKVSWFLADGLRKQYWNGKSK